MKSAPSVTIEAVARVETADAIPQHVIAAFHEAMIRDGRMAAMEVIAGRGHSFKEVSAAAQRMYGTQEGM